ncbi:MAG: flagellar basal body rod protein FlgC [Spirochaetes bacterium]|uniref:Flagellar basal-body rod protein FlgC n=1 Tax=Candidatus Avitreponema avistercoris TaxID=2840705 RepID=A0A9D9EPZ9_9SPIR|nr:flagellar basal body rod protein FlgC [Candidatus Avitreponema avistercoris]
MGLFSSINIAATGMSAQRLRSDVIADNIANATTTRTQEGGAFRRSRVILAQRSDGIDWRTPFTPPGLDRGPGTGVRVMGIEKDNADLRLVYDPTHPDAIQSGPKAGYVEYPNVNIVTEMVDLISASRAYEANASVIQGSKDMFQRAMEIGR